MGEITRKSMPINVSKDDNVSKIYLDSEWCYSFIELVSHSSHK